MEKKGKGAGSQGYPPRGLGQRPNSIESAHPTKTRNSSKTNVPYRFLLTAELRMPVVTTLHTVLREPRADQRRVMEGLISLSTRLVVMAERARRMLQEIYHAPPAKI